MSTYNAWSPDPAHRFLEGQERIHEQIAEQAKPNPVLQEMNFGQPARTEPFGGYYEKPKSTALMGSVSVIDVDERKKAKKGKKKDESVSVAGVIFWLFVIMMVIGWLAS